MTIRADIVVPTYNRAPSLARLLDALSRCHRRDEARVVIVDDGSEDSTGEIVNRSPIPVEYVRQDNAGPAVARNRGASTGRAPIVIFLDDDCVPRPAWLADFLDAFDRAPAVDAFGGRIVPLADTPVTRFVQAEGLVDHGRSRDTSGARFLVSANLGIRRAALTAIGGFDEEFPLAAAEDVDFSLRLLEAGSTMALLDGAVVGHDHPSTWSEVFAMYRRHGRGRVHLAAAHPGELTPVDAHRALSVGYWRARYSRYRQGASPTMSLVYGAGRVVGLAGMATGAHSERARLRVAATR